MRKKGNTQTLLVGMWIVSAKYKKLKTELLYDRAILLLAIYLMGMKTLIQREL